MRMAINKRGVSTSLIVGRSQYLGVVKVYSSREGSLPQSADNHEFVAQQPISGHEPWFESLSDLPLLSCSRKRQIYSRVVFFSLHRCNVGRPMSSAIRESHVYLSTSQLSLVSGQRGCRYTVSPPSSPQNLIDHEDAVSSSCSRHEWWCLTSACQHNQQ
jgi:hypothetical protein